MPPLADEDIPEVVALGRSVVAQLPPEQQKGSFLEGSMAIPLRDPAERGD